jgi:hypothetical protein
MIRNNYYIYKSLIIILAGILLLVPTCFGFKVLKQDINSKVLGKIYIDENGIYRIWYTDLIDAGLNFNNINPYTFRLMNKGKEIPLYVGNKSETTFQVNDYIEFYGEINRNRDGKQNEYSDTNIYYLSWGESTGLRWKIEYQSMDSVAQNTSKDFLKFRTTLLRKESQMYSRLAETNQDAQNLWYWRELAAPSNSYYNFYIPHYVSDTTLFCSLLIEFQGVSHVNVSPDHYVVIKLNNNLVGETRWDGQTRQVYQCDTVPVAFFKEGRNWLQISLPGKAGDSTGQASDIDVVHLIQFEITYWNSYKASNNELIFTPPVQPENPRVVNVTTLNYYISNFTSPEITIYDISHSSFIYPTVEYDKRTKRYTAIFNTTGSDTATYYIALSALQKKEPVRIEKLYYQDLSTETSGAEYLVIAHDDFYTAIQPLIEWRKSTGLTTKLVKISEIYDSFNNGLIDPKAIKAFISYTYKNWKPIPKYVLLVGDASVDLRGNTNQVNARLFIPTYYWQTYMGAAASDNWYVAVGSDETKPEMAIGRISAHSVEEVNNVVNKILQYERAPVYGNWRQKMLFLASPESMFEGISEELAKSYVPSYYEVYRRYPSSGSPDYKYRTEDIVGNINDGRIIMHFTGHGGGYVWESGRMDLEQHGVEVVPDNRDFFGFKNIQQLYNYGKYPFTIALTCYTGVFDNLNSDSLGEALLKSPFSGAIAVVSATWRSYVSSNDAFDRAMFTQMFQKKIRRVGDVFLNAKREINIPETSATYILLGDPATLLSFPQDTVQLQAVRSMNSKNYIQVYGTLNTRYKAKGTVVVKTEKGKTILEKNITLSNRNTFTKKIKIPQNYAQDSLVVYCYLWNKTTGWDAVGFTSVPRIQSDSTNQGKNIAMPQLLSSLLWGIIPNNADNKATKSTEEETEIKAQSLFESGESYYRKNDLLNALLKYSESFKYGNRSPGLTKRLKRILVPIETFEKVTAVQIIPFASSKPVQTIRHEITNEIAYRGKKSEVLELKYPEGGWYDFWGKDVHIPLVSPVGVRLYARSTVENTQLSLMVAVSFGTAHRVVFCSPLTQLRLNHWVDLEINDIYQIAKKRALSPDDNFGELKVYPELMVSYMNFDPSPLWDVNNMWIQKIGISTGSNPGQFWIDDIELFFPQYKLKYYQ